MKPEVVRSLSPENVVETSFVNLEEAQKIGLSRKVFLELWAQIPNSQYKLLFTSCTKLVDYCLPVKFDRSTGQMALDDKVTLDSISSTRVKLDPTKISSELLRNFGILDNPVKKVDITAQVVSELKAVFNSLTPVPATNNRIQIITQESPILNSLVARKPELMGSIIYFRKEIDSDHKLAMCFTSLSSAYRKTLHEEQHHIKEVDKLTRLAKNVVELRGQVGDWGQLDSDEKAFVRSFAGEVAGEVVEQLKNVLLLSKILGREQVAKSGNLRDRKERTNTSATWARLHAALDKFSKRLKSVTKITTANIEDRLALVKYRATHSEVFAKAERVFDKQIVFTKGLQAFTTGNRQLNPERTDKEITNYLTRLGLNDRLLSQVEARPYLTFKKQIDLQIANLRQAAQDKNTDSGSEALKQIRLVLQVVKLQESLDYLAEILTHGPVSFSGFKDRLVELKNAGKSFYEMNKADITFNLGFARQLELLDLAITGANETALKEVSEKSLRQFKGRFFSKLSFEKPFLS